MSSSHGRKLTSDAVTDGRASLRVDRRRSCARSSLDLALASSPRAAARVNFLRRLARRRCTGCLNSPVTRLARLDRRPSRCCRAASSCVVLRVVDLRRRVRSRARELNERDRDQDDEDPERERLGEAPPVELAFLRRCSVALALASTASSRCTAGAGSSRRDPAHTRPGTRCGASNPTNSRRILAAASAMCLCSSAQISSERGFRARKQVHQAAQRAAGVDDVLDEQDVLSLELGLRIVHQSYVAARHHRVAVARRDEEIDLQRPMDLAHEVAQEDEASLQQPEHEQVAVGIRRR